VRLIQDEKMINIQSRKTRAIPFLILGALMLVAVAPRNAFAATGSGLQSTDFTVQSFSKTVDYYDYVRQYAASQGYNITAIQNQHAYIYANYINVGGFQLFYAGLVNATDANHNNMNITIPIQTVFEHFKTPGGKDAITASSFLSLVSFQDNGTSDKYPNTPHLNDTIYASFSLGVNLTAITGHKMPSYVDSSHIIPLTSTDSNHWTWGLNYTNLNAIWWRIYPDPNAILPWQLWDALTPRGLAQYSQLSFTYDLAIDPTAKTATLTESYTVGQMTDLWLLTTAPIEHLNSTGTYNAAGTTKLSGTTIYQFLTTGGYKLSIVQSHTAVVANTATTDSEPNGTSVDNDNSVDVSNTSVNTVATGGETVFRSNFAAKPTYQLYNSTSGAQTTYNDTVRTVNRKGWGGNPVFWIQNIFMGFLPLFVYHVDPSLFAAAKAGMASFQVANYLYIISYPTWGGYKIVNDPQYEAFYQPAGSSLGLLTVIFIAIAVAAGIGGVFAFLFRRRRAPTTSMSGPSSTPGQSPGPTPGSSGAPSGPSQ
jgi:hypothetical protein